MELKDRTIDIFGNKWQIKYVDKLFPLHENDKTLVWGATYHERRLIKIATFTSDGKKIPNDYILNVLCHELMHVIFGEGNYLSCNDDEPLVEWCGKCLRSLIKQGVI